jgi:hypothetical protein
LRERWLNVRKIPGFGAWTKVLKMRVGFGCGVEVNERVGLTVLGTGLLKVSFPALDRMDNGGVCAG